MKKTKFSALLLAIFIAAAMIVTACSDNTEQPSDSSDTKSSDSSTQPTDQSLAAAVLEASGKLAVIEASATRGSLEEAMTVLKEAGELTYEGSDSEYGFYLTSVNGYTPDADSNEYWAVYTTLGEYDGVEYSNSEYGTYDYGGKTLASASYGVSGLPLVEGELYVLVVESY